MDKSVNVAEYRRKIRAAKLVNRPVIMWDGEGITREDGLHEYVILSNSRSETLESEHGLKTIEIFDHLLHHSGGKENLHIMFGMGYDIAMWLQSLSYEKVIRIPNGGLATGKQLIASIYTAESVVFHTKDASWRISYRPRKQFSLSKRPFGSNEKQSISIWEIWGYYQGTFVNALKAYDIPCDTKHIEEMKQKRGSFGDEDREEMLAYCISECKAGETLFKKTLSYMVEADLLPSRYDGPGALAASLFKREGVKQHIVLEPKEVRQAVACAFFGGRIELARIGSMEPVYSDDIASAYPSIIQNLPSLQGKWSREYDGNSVPLYRVRYKYDRGLPFYPLPYRTRQGAVLFSADGEGWYWGYELKSTRIWEERFNQKPAKCIESWFFTPTGEPPFTFVPEIFKLRSQWKKQGKGAEKILKLTLNSMYGKTAQQIGGSLEKLPPYFSLVWAGMITSGTRAELLKAACKAKNPENIIAFQTDGLFSREKLDIETKEGVLGAWEPTKRYTRGVFAQAGVYWLQNEGDKWKPKNRGFDRGSLDTPEEVLHAWKNWVPTEKETPHIKKTITRFQGYLTSMRSDAAWSDRTKWIETPKKLDITGLSAKREPATIPLKHASVPLAVKVNHDYLLDNTCSTAYDAITLPDFDKTEPSDEYEL